MSRYDHKSAQVMSARLTVDDLALVHRQALSIEPIAVPAESPTTQSSSVPVRVADDSTTQKENEHG